MTPWADIFINYMAALALIFLFMELRHKNNPQPIERAISHTVFAAAGLVLTRGLFWMSGIALFEILSLIFAVIIPLTVLLAAETLMRRHSHLMAKVLAAGWLLTGLVCVFTAGNPPVFTYANAAMQCLIPLYAAAWIFLRDKSEFTRAENGNMTVFILALLFIMGFAVTDFPLIMPLPVRLGAVAILIVAYLLVFARQKEFSARQAAVEIGAIAISVAAFLIMARLILGSGTLSSSVQLAALLSSILLTIVIAVRVLNRQLKFEDFSHFTLAEARTDTLDSFLEDTVFAHATSEAHILKLSSNGEYDGRLISELFKGQPVISRKSLEPSADMFMAGEQLADIFNRFNASHAFYLSGEPARLVIVAAPALNNGPQQDAYFQSVAKIAHLIAQKS